MQWITVQTRVLRQRRSLRTACWQLFSGIVNEAEGVAAFPELKPERLRLRRFGLVLTNTNDQSLTGPVHARSVFRLLVGATGVYLSQGATPGLKS
jgi:hypothetical protein